MRVDIKIPSIGESVVEATIGQILKPSGSQVKSDEEVIEIETDKVNQVLSAPAAGQVQFSVKTGGVVKVGQVIGFVETTAAGAAVEKAMPPQPKKPPEEKPKAAPAKEPPA